MIKRREDENKLKQSDMSIESILAKSRARQAARNDDLKKLMIDGCSHIEESSIVTEIINNVFELVASFKVIKQINDKMELDTVMELRENGFIDYDKINKHLARIEGFRRGAFNLAKVIRDRGDYEIAANCLTVVTFAEEKLALFIRVKEEQIRKLSLFRNL
jgi:hypothetical protein